MKKTLSILLVLLMLCSNAFTQQLKTYSGTRNFFYGGCKGSSMDLHETYTYYIDKDGSYIKSGNYSIKGTKSKMGGDVTVTYNLTATFKDGKLNGPLILKYSALGYCMYSYEYREKLYSNEEYTLSANFKNGKIDGKWSFSERDGNPTYSSYSSPTIYKTTFTCNNGLFVGDFDFDYDPMNKRPHTKGKFDENGNIVSLTIYNNEYTLDTTGMILSYINRNSQNIVTSKYQYDDVLGKEYEEQKQSSLIDFIKQKGYYINEKKEENQMISRSNEFSTAHLLSYIFRNCRIFDFIDADLSHKGSTETYLTHYCNYNKQNAEPLTDSAYSGIIENEVKNYMLNYYGAFSRMDDNTVIANVEKEYISEIQNVKFFTHRKKWYMDDSTFAQFEDKLLADWKFVKDSVIRSKQQKIFASVEKDVKKCLDEIKLWPRDGYEKEYEIYEMSGSGYSQSYKREKGIKLELHYPVNENDRWRCYQDALGYREVSIIDLMIKFQKFHKVMDYEIDSIHLSDKWDTCYVDINIYTESSPYKCHRTQAIYNMNSGKLLWKESYNKAEKVITICDTSKSLSDEMNSLYRTKYDNSGKKINIYKILKSDQTYNAYESELSEPSPLEEDINVWNDYFRKLIPIQKDYIAFIKLSQEIRLQSAKIDSLRKSEVADVVKSYDGVSPTWSLEVSEKGKIKDEIKRLEGYTTIQDSCLAFIELRKSISQNNAEISQNAKTAKTIVGAFDKYIKGTDLSWSQDMSRNNALREILETQTKLISVLKKDNIAEIENGLKKQKDKSWDAVKKQIFD